MLLVDQIMQQLLGGTRANLPGSRPSQGARQSQERDFYNKQNWIFEQRRKAALENCRAQYEQDKSAEAEKFFERWGQSQATSTGMGKLQTAKAFPGFIGQQASMLEGVKAGAKPSDREQKYRDCVKKAMADLRKTQAKMSQIKRYAEGEK